MWMFHFHSDIALDVWYLQFIQIFDTYVGSVLMLDMNVGYPCLIVASDLHCGCSDVILKYGYLMWMLDAILDISIGRRYLVFILDLLYLESKQFWEGGPGGGPRKVRWIYWIFLPANHLGHAYGMYAHTLWYVHRIRLCHALYLNTYVEAKREDCWQCMYCIHINDVTGMQLRSIFVDC